MFQFTPFPSCNYVFIARCVRITARGFPHSDICGSMDMCSSPQLFAAYHVLLRLPVPRHPPDALVNLTLPVYALYTGLLHYYCQSVNFLVSLNKFDLMNRLPTISSFTRFVVYLSFTLGVIQFSRYNTDFISEYQWWA